MNEGIAKPAWWQKKKTTYAASGFYGLLQAGGTSGYAMITLNMLADMLGKKGLIDDFIPGTEVDWLTASIGAFGLVSVFVINGLLVREDVDKGIRPHLYVEDSEEAKLLERNEKACRIAWGVTLGASFVMALIAAYGMQATLDYFLVEETNADLGEAEDPSINWKPWINIALFTAVVWFAEFRLLLRDMQLTFAKMAEKEALLPDYSKYEAGTKWRYNLLLSAIVIGLLGTVLICTPTLADWLSWLTEGEHDKTLSEVKTNAGSEAVAFIFLLFMAAVQVPLYMGRAKGLIESRKLPSQSIELPTLSTPGPEKPKTAVEKAYTFFWIPNAVFNAPLAMVGIAGTIATFMGNDLEDMFTADMLKYIGIIFGIAVLGAGAASAIVNSKTPPELKDDQQENDCNKITQSL